MRFSFRGLSGSIAQRPVSHYAKLLAVPILVFRIRRIFLVLVIMSLSATLIPYPQHFVPTAQATNTAVSNCQTLSQPGNYSLGQNIVLSSNSGNCVDIEANNVIFDCVGHSITGPAAAYAGANLFYVVGNYSVVKNCILSDAGQGVAVAGNHDLILNNTISNMWEAIQNGWTANYNRYENNTAFHNRVADGRAFTIWWGAAGAIQTGNVVTGNNFTDSNYGIDLGSCSPTPFPCITGNLFYNNYLAGNTVNARDLAGYNSWNISKTPGTNIVGGPFLGGNFWSDYNGTDTDRDFLGDTLLPYTVAGNISHGGDYFPLVVPPPDFNISASPASLTIQRGTSGSSTINLASLHNFSGTVTLNPSVAPSFPTDVSVNPSTNRIYVANTAIDSVLVIDGRNDTVISTIRAGSGTRGLGVNPNTNTIYATNRNSNTTSVIDGSTNTVVATIGLLSFPFGVGVNPSTNMIYVANEGSNTVSVIDGSKNVVIATIPVGFAYFGIGVNPSTNRIYVTNPNQNTVSVIDGSTNSIVTTISVGTAPRGVAVNPSTNRIYVANDLSNTVSVIDGSSNTVVATVMVGAAPQDIAVNPSTQRIYVTNLVADTVSVVDTSANAVVATIGVGSSPEGVAVNPSVNKIYVGNYASSSISVIDGSSNIVLRNIVGPTLVLPPSVSLVPGSTGHSTLTVYTSTTTTPGTYTINVTASSGSLNHATTVAVIVTDFGISATSACSGLRCATFGTIIITAFEGFSGIVTLTDNVPSGLSCGPITPTSLTLPPWPATATLTCSSSMIGDYMVNVTATNGAQVHSANVTFTCSTVGAPCSSSVGGKMIPVNKLALSAPYIGLVSLIVVATAATLYFRRSRRQRDGQ